MNRRVILIGAALALSLSGAFAAGPRDPRTAIEAANAEFAAAYGRRDARAVAAMYTEGGQLYPPNERVVAEMVQLGASFAVTSNAVSTSLPG